MILEQVNGETRQVFDFSKPGVIAKFYAPVSIGAGYRKEVEQGKVKNTVIDPKWVSLATSFLKSKKKPPAIPEKAWQAQMQQELQALILEQVQGEDLLETTTPDEDLIILKTLLTPASDSISVKKWYKEKSTDEEVKQVTDFFYGVAESKIESEPSTRISGKARSKKAGGR